jgi:hypothetical protein
MTYRPARERLSSERRSEIARHAALTRALLRVSICACGHEEREHWSIGSHECRTCEIDERPQPCAAFSPLRGR